MDFSDRLEDVILAAKNRRYIESEPTEGCFDLISLPDVHDGVHAMFRDFQISVEKRFGVRMNVIGGGSGCFRLEVSVTIIDPEKLPIPNVEDSVERVKFAVAKLITTPEFQILAKEQGFTLATVRNPYSRVELGSGKIESYSGLTLFISYAHKDPDALETFHTHLAALKVMGLLKEWDDREIGAGWDWENEIDSYLEKAHIVAFLVTPSFIASNYCMSKEFRAACKRHETGNTPLIPILVKNCVWKQTGIERFQYLPRSEKFIKDSRNRDAAWAEVVDEIRQIAQRICSGAPEPTVLQLEIGQLASQSSDAPEPTRGNDALPKGGEAITNK